MQLEHEPAAHPHVDYPRRIQIQIQYNPLRRGLHHHLSLYVQHHPPEDPDRDRNRELDLSVLEQLLFLDVVVFQITTYLM